MLPGPVFNVELLTTARRPRYYVVRLVYGLILLFFIAQNDPNRRSWSLGSGADSSVSELTIQEMARLGQALFATFLTVQSIAVLLLTPALVAGVIADEKQRKTLHYLLASRLTSGEIILGKLAARMLLLGVLVAIGFPVMSLLSLFGGVDPIFVAVSFVATLTTAFFLAALSILVSTHARRPREAISLVYMLEVCWLFGPGFLALSMPNSGPRWAELYQWILPVLNWIGPTNPLDMLRTSNISIQNRGQLLEYFLWMMGLQLAYGSLFVVIALLRLRRVNRNEGGGRFSAWTIRIRRGRRLLPRPECGDDAMLWKECYVSRTSLVVKLLVSLVAVGAVGGLGYLTYQFATPAFSELLAFGYGSEVTNSARNEFNGYLRVVCTLIYILLGMAIASSASSGLTSEREEDTWISLVATPLGGLEIIRAKIIGAFWAHRWIALVLMLLWCLGVAAGSVHPMGFVVVAIETAVFLWFAAALGTYYSLRAKSSGRSLVAVIGTLIVLNGAYLMCCLPFLGNSNSEGILLLAGVTPMIEAFSLGTYSEFGLLFTGSARSEPVRFVATSVVGTMAYAIGACVLTYRAFDRFDEEAGRAYRSLAVPPTTPIFFKEAEAVAKIGQESESTK